MKIEKEQLMQQMVNDPESVRAIYLIPSEMCLFKFISVVGETDTARVCKKFGTSSQSATQRLTRLYQKGYITRYRDSDRTYKYSVSIQGAK